MVKFIKKDERNIQVGLDIGNHSVKAVSISYSEKRPRVLGFSRRPLGTNPTQDIKTAYDEIGLMSRNVIASISGPSVVARYVEMPSMTEQELKGAARFEAEKVIPYSLNEVMIDAAKLEDLGENRMRVLLVAAKKDMVTMRLNTLYEAGLKPLILDIDSFALMNAFVTAGINKKAICGLLNIGAKITSLNIIKGDKSYLSRDIEIGGNDITKAISEKFSLPENEAEKVKVVKLSEFAGLPPEEKKELAAVFGGILSEMTNEVRLCFDFYETHYAGNIEKVYVSGGTSQSEEINRRLAENLGCEILSWDPLANMEVTEGLTRDLLKQVRSQLAVAVGLALRSID